MRIANRHIILAAGLVWAMSITPAFAADPVVSPPPIAPPTILANAAPKDINSDEKVSDLYKSLPGGKKTGDVIDVKVPDSVKDVIKRLGTKADDITLDDLNAAREAVAKLDALIDIEKRLVDLDKIRNERNKESDKKIAEAIPKTALTPPPSFLPSPSNERVSAVKIAMTPKPVPVELDIIRIEGSNNRYGALVKDAGAARLVHAGDHLSDGSVVLSVTTQGVEYERDRVTHLTHIKDVQAVFGNNP